MQPRPGSSRVYIVGGTRSEGERKPGVSFRMDPNHRDDDAPPGSMGLSAWRSKNGYKGGSMEDVTVKGRRPDTIRNFPTRK
jgi:hypothetical protein